MAANGSAAVVSEHDESSPLLGREAANGHGAEPGSSAAPPPVAAAFGRRNLAAAVFVTVIVVMLEAAGALQVVPLNQILEDIICKHAYPERPALSERPDCGSSKVVQGELALLRGWYLTLELIPGLLTAIPYGFVADKYGRKLVFVLCIVGLILCQAFYLAVCWWDDVFPVRLIWLSAAFTFVGGGAATMNGLFYTMLADLTPPALLANAFFAMGAALYAAEMLVNPLVARLMATDVWLPIYIGSGMYLFALLLSLGLPETKAAKDAGDVPPDLAPDDGLDLDGAKTVWAQVKDGLDSLRTAAVFFIWGNRNVALLLSTLLTATLGKHAQDIMLQFARKRFGWSWADTNYLVSLKAATVLVLLTAILPACSYALTRHAAMSPPAKDLLLSRISCAVMVTGTLTIGFSPSSAVMVLGMVTYVVGAAYNLLLRSLISFIVEPHHRGTLFNTTSILETLGSVIAGPLLAQTFRAGMALGGMWVGLPFMVASVLFLEALVVNCAVRLPRIRADEA